MSGSVLVLHTGGTIGMVGSPDGQTTVAGALGPYLDWIVESSRGDLPPIAFLELDPLIDSANATPDEWCDIARTLYEHRADHTGFVVLHGTDTMAYTSSALSFLLPNFGRPVVVTGSQIPITRTRSDGRQNLIGALQVAAGSQVPEVTLLFGEALFRGNRATKVDASGLDAFDSPRFPPLAEIGIDIVVNHALVRSSEGHPGLVVGELGRVAAMRLFPDSPLPSSRTCAAATERPRHRGLWRRQRPVGGPGVPGSHRGRHRRRHRGGHRDAVRQGLGATG
jgi:L-asparaginase